MEQKLKLALIQIRTETDKALTMDKAERMIRQAAQNGANHKIIDDFRDKFMSACDGGSAQRIADFVEKNN